MKTLNGAAIVLIVVWFSSPGTAQVGDKLASKAPVGSAAARLNVTGAWDGNFWGGSGFQLTQDGDRVWGRFTYGNGDGFARGSWRDGRLLLILTPTAAQVGGTCDPRKILVIEAKGTVTRLEPFWLDFMGNVSATGAMTRTSPSPGPAI